MSLKSVHVNKFDSESAMKFNWRIELSSVGEALNPCSEHFEDIARDENWRICDAGARPWFAATHIQRVFRGHCARVRAGLLRKVEAVAAKERARLAAQAAIEARLMRIGAAALMQGWWRSLQRRWLTRAMVMVMKRRAAIRIQSFWRSVWAVLELKRAIARKRDQDARESAAATMLQKRFRIRRAQALVERIKVEAAEAKAQRDASRIENMQDRTMNIFGRTLNVTKNRRVLHELRSKIDPFTASRQERAATRIQRVWRGYRARRRVKRRRAAENHVLSRLRRDKVRAAALQMQKRWRGIRERRRLEMERQNRAASLIQAKYRARIARRNFVLILERHKAASRVQKRWRGRLARKMMVLFREEMRVQNAAARVCQRAVQRYLFRKGYRDRLENERTWFELRQQGAIETILAKRAEGYRMLLHSGFLNSAKGGGELRALFCELSEPLAQLSGDKFVKMVLACPGLAHLERKTLDIIFAKAKKPDSKLLGYPEFRESLIGLGMHLYVAEGVDAKIKAYKDTVQAERAKAKRGRFSGGSSGAAQSAEAARAQRQAEKDADKKAETQIRDEAIGQFTFRRHRGRRGLLLRVLHEHIWNMEFAQRQREALDARAARRMEWASVMVQRRFRGVASRSILDRIREQRHREIEAERQRAASTLIQTFWRMCLAKRRVRALARRCLQKCIDAETGDPYWFNTQTGESSWTKPKLLGNDEAEVSIVMPQKDDEFVIKCAKCRAEMATVACLDCADPFCEDCHRQEHHGATMHTNIPIPLCTECNFQAATRNCAPCQRKFCCSCFEMAHFISPPWQDEPVCAQPSEEQSQLAAHKWQPLIKVCAECDARAVRWRCEECGDDFCARCLKDLHRKGNRRLHNFHPLSYHSLQLEVRERQVRAKKRAIAEKERRKVMQKQAEQDNMEKVALKLQSLYRGRRDRAVGKSLLRDARLRERKHWRLVKHDMAERKKLNYRLQAAVGIAPILETDDDETKDRKRMGWKATPWGRAAVAAGVALPIGEALPGPIKVHDNETLFIHVIEEWRSLISVDEYIRLDSQYFLVKHIGEQDENDPGKPVDTVQMMREEKLRKRQENDPWAVAAASEESSTAGETGKSKKKNNKKKKKKTKDQNSGEDQGGEVGPEGIHLDAPFSGEIPVEVRGFFVGSFNLAQDAIVKAKRADKQAIKEKMGGRFADVMAKTKEFIAEKADEYIDPDTAARLNKRFTGVARLVGKRRSSIASLEDMDDEDLGEADEAPKVSTPPKSATQAAKASLPPGWEEFLDDASGTPYFYNHSTGESVWERPFE
ncbi:Peptidyl-prolyl cis-trans isomerase NIMA-interacting 1 [Hondaea fermentalgiana]|uniref:Peptidyl-prolyl cis-trans isomerase NIMA-interacting 1 n=1 Tax=Hondaea fermentalgiana TaxID=2315210 RepID=A0A2R5GT23_9STRA|nr:Peptidyl-prolyl cis-trans isomerase NIMA-interacting 1 [Hondaea fermentalgiana]|eukprot:GBG33990.1 Peptidyl-prolyl cis-trans isomerase NIMA-interacting 1 [Hondaea fermentalgiana]